jgi:hypothetical protein
MSDAVKLICAQDEIAHLRSEVDRFRAEVIRLGGLLNAGWIACSERLPEMGEWVLVVAGYDGKGDVWQARRYSATHWDGNDFWHTYDQVTHWMPLPEPPYDVTQCSQSGSALQKDVGRDASERDDDGSPGRELPDE